MNNINDNNLNQQYQELQHVLQEHFSGSINITDDSHLHAGHNHGGGKHYTVHIVDEKFNQLSRMHRHRMIYQILEDYISTNKIHALSLKLYTPYEYFSEN